MAKGPGMTGAFWSFQGFSSPARQPAFSAMAMRWSRPSFEENTDGGKVTAYMWVSGADQYFF